MYIDDNSFFYPEPDDFADPAPIPENDAAQFAETEFDYLFDDAESEACGDESTP